MGPFDSRAVLFFHRAPNTRLHGFGEDVLDKLDVRLIVLQRPGFGRSTALRGRSLLDWPSDVAEVADGLGLPEIPIVGFSAGGAFAMACAHAMPDRVAKVVLASATDEVAHERFDRCRPDWLQTVAETARSDPEQAAAGLLRVIRTGNTLEDVISSSSPQDAFVYGSAGFRAQWGAALRDAEANGKDATAWEVVIAAATRWPFDVSKVTTPVELWYGEHDWNGGHSPDKGASLAELLPNATHRLLADEGASLLWTRSEAILHCCLE